MMTKRALVLGAGGHAASAWEIGIIAGMADAGVALRDCSLFIGTSAGARVATQLASGVKVDDLFARQIETRTAERTPDFDLPQWRSRIARQKLATAVRNKSSAALARWL